MLLDISRRYRMRDLIDTNFPAIIPPGQVPIWNGVMWVVGAPVGIDNVDGGSAASVYGGIDWTPVDGGQANTW